MNKKENKELKEIAEFVRKRFLKTFGTGLPYQILDQILKDMVEEFRIKYVSEIAISEEIVPTVTDVLNNK